MVSSAGRRSIIGKKVKKAFNKVSKVIRKVDPFTAAVEDSLSGMGLPTLVGKETGMLSAYGRTEEAKKQAAADAAERKRVEEQGLLATRDSNADLSSGYFADVRSGSSRKRRGISASLGL